MEPIEQNMAPIEPIAPEALETEPADIADEVSLLRRAMHSKITEAVALGVFTDKEAGDWEAGFDACTEVEHMYNLIEIIDDFIASGLDIIDAISDKLNTDLLTSREKATWEMMADRLSYQEKHRLLAELSAILSSVAKNKQQLFKLLQSNKLSLTKAKELINTFADVEADDKTKVVDQAKLTVVNEAGRQRLIRAEVMVYVARQQYAEARTYLSDNSSFLEADNHVAIMGVIDNAEIIHTQQAMYAA
ncbi:TPA: hypothetical protein DIV45_00720 [Patescibacteria group bacterium]|nr:hypothetical protein [Patescibacteria group bacterium]